ncbi:MAG: alpha/beta hydrolase [Thermoguttaceae bacterium]|nr:alpha/beta hydrolase [Thermoguttaceae bacterium]MDW8036792.1 alpha/beta fold hydrolase [Thermoguttaceae bacterium]
MNFFWLYRSKRSTWLEPDRPTDGGKSWFMKGAIICIGLMCCSLSLGYAQSPKETPKIPPPKDITLETRDGVILRATYYPSWQGKEAVAVLMLHDFEGNRADLAPLAMVLQRAGHAALTLDLRGHGESTTVKGATRTLNATQLSNEDFQRMVAQDIEQAKRFLREENNEGRLNLEKLCVIGVGMGATLALEWARLDWSWPPLVTYKQGQDVKALVLISPEFTFRSLSGASLFKHPQASRRISALIIFGETKPKALQDAKRIHSMFERVQPQPEKPEQRTLFLIPRKTNLQGSRLIDEKNLRAFQIDQLVLNFLRLRLVEQDYPWSERRVTAQ